MSCCFRSDYRLLTTSNPEENRTDQQRINCRQRVCLVTGFVVCCVSFAVFSALTLKENENFFECINMPHDACKNFKFRSEIYLSCVIFISGLSIGWATKTFVERCIEKIFPDHH